MSESEGLSVKVGPVSIKYGIPGVLLTTGIALLALSASRPDLFSAGVAFLLLGILSFIAKEAAGLALDIADDYQKEGSWEPRHSLASLYIFVLVVLAVIVFWL